MVIPDNDPYQADINNNNNSKSVAIKCHHPKHNTYSNSNSSAATALLPRDQTRGERLFRPPALGQPPNDSTKGGPARP